MTVLAPHLQFLGADLHFFMVDLKAFLVIFGKNYDF
jgi:hypothetical protein